MQEMITRRFTMPVPSRPSWTFTSYTDALESVKTSTSPWVNSLKAKIIEAYEVAPASEDDVKEIIVNDIPLHVQVNLYGKNKVPRISIAEHQYYTREPLQNFMECLRAERSLMRTEVNAPKSFVEQVEQPSAKASARTQDHTRR
jgi:hypothetical protein